MSTKKASQILIEAFKRKSPYVARRAISQLVVEVVRRYKVAVNPALEAFIFANETLWGTFVAPNKGIFIESCNVDSDRPTVIPETTGAGYDQRFAWLGEKKVIGDLVVLAWPQYVPSLLRCVFPAVVSTRQAMTAAYRHKMLPSDTTTTTGFSGEKLLGGKSQFFKGGLINRLVISAKAKEPVRFTMGILAQDEAWSGGNWEDGTSAPAASTDPIPYSADLVLPFRFEHGQVLTGGALSLTSGEIVVTGGSAVASIEACEITIEQNIDAYPGLNNTPCAVNYRPQARKITLKADLDWVTADNAYVLEKRSLTEAIWQLKCVGTSIEASYSHEFIVTLPRVVLREAKVPAIGGTKTRRKHPITYEALREVTTTNVAIGLVVQNTEATI